LQQCTNEHEIRMKIEETEKFIKDRYKNCVINAKIYDGQLEFITYFKKDWVNELMHMWTFYGRKKAADILAIDVNVMPWTTDYLEGFRRQFNSKRILRFQRKGHVLRLDALGVMLVKCITPICNIQRDLWNNIDDILNRKSQSQGEEEFEEGVIRALFDHYINTIAFDDLDPRKEEEANLFLINEKIKFIEFNGQYLFVKIQCDIKNPEYVPNNKNMDYYIVCLAPFISCHCFNFLLRGGACSHIRAAIKVVNWMRLEPRTRIYFNNLEHWEMPHIQLDSRIEALKGLHKQNHRKVFPFQSDDPIDDENCSDSEDEDVDPFDPRMNFLTGFDKWTFGVGTSSTPISALTEGSSTRNPIAINDTGST
ncbi:6060_t:CDS:2, partial [Funneliformis mosseae]